MAPHPVPHSQLVPAVELPENTLVGKVQADGFWKHFILHFKYRL
jgi:hypothetical protein